LFYLLSIIIILLWDSKYNQYYVEFCFGITLCIPFFFIIGL
jgi:hypothetical protein